MIKDSTKRKSLNAKIKKLLFFADYLFKYCSILCSTFFIYKIHFPIVTKINIDSNKKLIFTFWEPYRKMPGYLRLCIKTWKKFLPEYEIEILDYNNLEKFLGKELSNNILSKKMSKSIQADGIRVALLNKYGGIWMDTDTIILNKDFLIKLNESELCMFGDTINKTQHIGFIYAKKNSLLINKWNAEIIKNVNNYKLFLKTNNNDKNRKNSSSKIKVWNYLGNGIIDPLVQNINDEKIYLRLDKYEMNIFPELKYFENSSLDNMERYQEFYFKNRDPKVLINRNNSILLLHNSWTPKRYKKMSEKRFLRKNILISKLLAQLLNITQ